MTFTEPLRCWEGWRLRHGPVCNGCPFSLTPLLTSLHFWSFRLHYTYDCLRVHFKKLYTLQVHKTPTATTSPIEGSEYLAIASPYSTLIHLKILFNLLRPYSSYRCRSLARRAPNVFFRTQGLGLLLHRVWLGVRRSGLEFRVQAWSLTLEIV